MKFKMAYGKVFFRVAYGCDVFYVCADSKAQVYQLLVNRGGEELAKQYDISEQSRDVGVILDEEKVPPQGD